jgi:hypothetical protein
LVTRWWMVLRARLASAQRFDGRPYTTTAPTGLGFGSGPTKINRPTRQGGHWALSLPKPAVRAVTGCTRRPNTHAFKFTTTLLLLKVLTQGAVGSPAVASRMRGPPGSPGLGGGGIDLQRGAPHRRLAGVAGARAA